MVCQSNLLLGGGHLLLLPACRCLSLIRCTLVFIWGVMAIVINEHGVEVLAFTRIHNECQLNLMSFIQCRLGIRCI